MRNNRLQTVKGDLTGCQASKSGKTRKENTALRDPLGVLWWRSGLRTWHCCRAQVRTSTCQRKETQSVLSARTFSAGPALPPAPPCAREPESTQHPLSGLLGANFGANFSSGVCGVQAGIVVRAHSVHPQTVSHPFSSYTASIIALTHPEAGNYPLQASVPDASTFLGV